MKKVIPIYQKIRIAETLEYCYTLNGYTDLNGIETKLSKPRSYCNRDMSKAVKGFMSKVGKVAREHSVYFVGLDVSKLTFVQLRTSAKKENQMHWARSAKSEWGNRKTSIKTNGKTYLRNEMQASTGYRLRNCGLASDYENTNQYIVSHKMSKYNGENY